MCVVSMVGDHYKGKWPDDFWIQPRTYPNRPVSIPSPIPDKTEPFIAVSRKEFEQLKRDVLEMKELLKRAKEYDERENEPHCEIEEKMKFLRQVAKAVGVDLDDVLGKE